MTAVATTKRSSKGSDEPRSSSSSYTCSRRLSGDSRDCQDTRETVSTLERRQKIVRGCQL